MATLSRFNVLDARNTALPKAGLTAPQNDPRHRIDYVRYSPPLGARSSVVLPSSVSDHRAVRSVFALPAGTPEVCIPRLDGPIGADPSAGRRPAAGYAC